MHQWVGAVKISLKISVFVSIRNSNIKNFPTYNKKYLQKASENLDRKKTPVSRIPFTIMSLNQTLQYIKTETDKRSSGHIAHPRSSSQQWASSSKASIIPYYLYDVGVLEKKKWKQLQRWRRRRQRSNMDDFRSESLLKHFAQVRLIWKGSPNFKGEGTYIWWHTSAPTCKKICKLAR